MKDKFYTNIYSLCTYHIHPFWSFGSIVNKIYFPYIQLKILTIHGLGGGGVNSSILFPYCSLIYPPPKSPTFHYIFHQIRTTKVYWRACVGIIYKKTLIPHPNCEIKSMIYGEGQGVSCGLDFTNLNFHLYSTNYESYLLILRIVERFPIFG